MTPSPSNASTPKAGASRTGLGRACAQGLLIVLLAGCVGFLINTFRGDGLALVQDYSTKSPLAVELEQQHLSIDIDEARALHSVQGAVFVDARSDDDYLAGHISGALNIPWSDFDNRQVEALTDVTPDSFVIVYCDGEACSLSHEVANALIAQGFANVRVLVNGWSVWKNAGLPTEPPMS